MSSQGTFLLRPVGPYDFDLSYSFYWRSRFEMVDRFADVCFARPILFDDVPVLIKISCGKGCLIDSLRVQWFSPGEVRDRQRLRDLLTRMFCLNFDLNRFYQRRLDPVMRRLVRRLVGLRPILTPDVFEAAAWAIIGQQVNLEFAYRVKSRLVETVNRTFEIDGETYHLFPTAADIAALDLETLRSLQFSTRKAEYLLDFSRMVASGKIDLESLGSLDYDTACEKLISIRGLGPWSANYILLRGAGHLDAFPIGDSGLNRAVKTLYCLDRKPETKHLLQLGDRWRPYRSLATCYLWKSLSE